MRFGHCWVGRESCPNGQTPYPVCSLCDKEEIVCARCARMLAATSTMDVATVLPLLLETKLKSQAASMSRAKSSGTHVFHLISALPQGSLNGTHLRGSKQYTSMVSLRDFPYYNYPVIGGEPWMMYFPTTR